jgi:hypothetical protein
MQSTTFLDVRSIPISPDGRRPGAASITGAVPSGHKAGERAAKDVTLDQILRAYAAAGGRIAIREVAGPVNKTVSARRTKTTSRSKPKKASTRAKVHIELLGTSN